MIRSFIMLSGSDPGWLEDGRRTRREDVRMLVRDMPRSRRAVMG